MNFIWGFMLIGGIILAILTGRGPELTEAIFSGSASAVKLFIELISAYVLWMGVLNIAKKSGMVEAISKKLRRVLGFLFPELDRDSQAFGFITLNFVANMLGLGNAATPLGIRAMEEMQKGRKSVRATNAMCMFLVINASAITLIPTTLISMRSAAGSADPAGIVLPTLIATVCSTIAGIIAAKLLQRRG